MSLFDRKADEGVQRSLFDEGEAPAVSDRADRTNERSLVERAVEASQGHAAERANQAIESYAETYWEYLREMERRDARIRELEDELSQADIEADRRPELEAELASLREQGDISDGQMTEREAETQERLSEYYRQLGNTEADAQMMAIDRAKQTRAEIAVRLAAEARRRRGEIEMPLPEATGEPLEATVETASGDRVGIQSMGGLPKLKPGDFALVERRFIEDGMFAFDGKERLFHHTRS